MYDVQQIQDEFMGLVGLRQSNNPEFDRLSSDIVKSTNNVLLTHPLLNIENLDMCARNYGDYQFAAWSGATTYAIEARVREDDVVYQSKQNANLNHAVTDTDWWESISLLSLYLEDVFRNGIDDVLNDFVNEKKLRREAKTLFDNVILFEGTGSKNDLIVNDGSLVGFAFKLKSARNLVGMIKRIGHQFSQDGNLPVWIYHSSQVEGPIATVTIARTKINSFQWTDYSYNIRSVDADYDSNGTFFFMYDQDLAPGQAINKRRVNGWDMRPCTSCSTFDIRMWNLYSKYMSVRAVRVKAANRALPEGSDEGGPDLLWDVNITEYVDTNWGLNFEFMVKCDMTELLIQHKDIFSFAIRDRVTVKLLEILINSTRQNGDETKTGPKAQIALQARSVGGDGLREQADKQTKAIDFEFSGFDDFCLPCNNRAGLNYGAGGLVSR